MEVIVLFSSYSISSRCTERSAQYFQLAAVLRKTRGSPEDVISSLVLRQLASLRDIKISALLTLYFI